MNRKWWKEGVVYQIYPRSYKDSNGDGIGDLQGIIQKLDYINNLGANIIWLCPVYRSPNDDNGYDISDYLNIMEEFGTMKDFDTLLSEMKKRNMKLIMDLVVNHTSSEHEWFVKSSSSKDNPYRDYYIWKPGKNGGPPNNWTSYFEGSAWEFDEKTGEYYLHLFSRRMPDLNWENENLRRDIYDMMLYWLDKGIDGFRMDVINFISKDQSFKDGNRDNTKFVVGEEGHVNGPRIHEFLQEMHRETFAKYDTMTVGETFIYEPEDALSFVGEGRNEMDMVFHLSHMSIDMVDGVFWTLKDIDLVEFKEILSKWQYVLDGKGWNSQFLANHDQPRPVSRFGNDGKYRVESAKMLATMIHTLQGTPFVYQGEEIGMTNTSFNDVSELRDVWAINYYNEEIEKDWNEKELLKWISIKTRDNARTPMQWDDSQNAGFTDGTPWIKVNPNYKDINVEASLKDENSIFNFYKKLIQLRKDNLVLVYGKYDLLLEKDKSIFSYLRTLENERLLIIINFFEPEVTYKLPEEVKYEKAELLLSNYEVNDKNISEITLKPYEARIYKLF